MDFNTISPAVEELIRLCKTQKMSKKEIRKAIEEDKKRTSSPEYIDKYIYEMEHDFIFDGIADWRGCNVDESWEEYKEKVGYYKRHPEREKESRAFTKEVIAWWQKALENGHEK